MTKNDQAERYPIDMRELLDRLESMRQIGPVELKLKRSLFSGQDIESPDAILEMRWRGITQEFAVEVKSRSNPRTVREAASRAKYQVQSIASEPLLVVPYLNEEVIRILQELEVSAIDLSGNATITTDKIVLQISGKPNLFPQSKPIRNPYSGDSSIFTRSLLLKQEFESLSELLEFASARILKADASKTPSLALSTASKTINALYDDGIVNKGKDGRIQLIDRSRLIWQISRRYRPSSKRKLVGKTSLDVSQMWDVLAKQSDKYRSAATGVGSAAYYNVLTESRTTSLYVDSIDPIADALDIQEGRAFANIELIEAKGNLVFFDIAVQGNRRWASILQTWLELAEGNAREIEASESLLARIQRQSETSPSSQVDKE